MSLKVVLQDGIKDCGICCLLSIIRFYGGEVSKEYLRKLTNTNKDGVTAYCLIEAARFLGMEADGVNGDLKNLENNNLPCIAHVHVNANYQHFVVIYKISQNKVIIMDPAVGKRVLSISEFKLMSTSNFIILKVKKKLPIFNHKRVVYKFFTETFIIYKNYFILLLFLTLNLILFEILMSFTFKYLLTYAIEYLNSLNILSILICLVFISLFNFIINLLKRKMLYKFMFIFDAKLTISTFKQLLLLPYFYYKNRTIGEVLSRFNDLGNLKNYFIQLFSFVISDFISLVIFTCFLLKINKFLSISIIVYYFLCSAFIYFRSSKKRKLYKKVRYYDDTIQSYIIESLSNVDTTKGCHLEKRFYDKFLIKYKNLLSFNYNYLNHYDFSFLFINLIENLLIIITYSLGSYFVINNKLKVENLILFTTFFQYCLKNFNRFIGEVEEMPNHIISLNRVEELYSILHENFKESSYYSQYNLIGKIELCNLFYQNNNKIILNKVNLTINPRDKVLLFGKSGSGKSTLVKMLVRYIEVPYSMIKIDGIDINHYHLENIRQHISYVSANERLFNDSVYNNICLYRDVQDDEFIFISKICRVDQIFGNDVKNYKQMIEENGFLLSSGERQRIVLARALLRHSNIYIFDEAFGQIDVELTDKILRDIFNYLENKIVIVISHRKNCKKHFNRIIKLMDGKLYEKEL